MSTTPKTYDLVGVGTGPANLSLAALTAREPDLSTVFLERKPAFDWHPGLMLPDAEMQVHFLKDLVSPVDPTNPYSFPAFLVDTKRLYRLLVTGRSKVPRREFEQYCRWAADRMDNLRFGVTSESVEWDGGAFLVHTTDGVLRARNVSVGTGLPAKLPQCATGHDPERVFHSEQLLKRPQDFAGKRVAVVGGGQSGAEVVHYLLSSQAQRPAKIIWGTRRTNLLPLDDSPFIDELFLPDFSRYFYTLPEAEREEVVGRLRMASDGISLSLLQDLYRRLYDLELLEGERPCRILLDQYLATLEQTDGALLATWQPARGGTPLREEVDLVVCATGYEHGMSELLLGLKDRLTLQHGTPLVRPDFSLDWDGPAQNRIYVQNAARREFGVADPNLSLLAWRSAVIANSVLGYERYDTGAVSTALDWEPLSAVGQA
ncbi:lysine N(6)-hydroxylase/L-ornithine N(5)-oxygenase family protein [Streptomyces resistomycificus]|uniref:L-lysine N6-monooxygenase MbtG n=1 Tax=Streptomyces resistomycificus TaxID=67356 RepID=A0A0L8LG06_9ACTN|nr:SidA/IucD/PvdA family monooxygenase [Streptomyces resistomycificus]KOG37055.1 L-lysine 6-monooxygenase [Streptomyces resistomycificus]KUN95002.1 L-lysine 6-monooxygenase [Streptomyces resistomycificus]